MSALKEQIGGDHYKGMKIQPAEYAHANGLDGFGYAVLKYITRWKLKGGLADLRKAIHTLQVQVELEERSREALRVQAKGEARTGVAESLRQAYECMSTFYGPGLPTPTVHLGGAKDTCGTVQAPDTYVDDGIRLDAPPPCVGTRRDIEQLVEEMHAERHAATEVGVDKPQQRD